MGMYRYFLGVGKTSQSISFRVLFKPKSRGAIVAGSGGNRWECFRRRNSATAGLVPPCDHIGLLAPHHPHPGRCGRPCSWGEEGNQATSSWQADGCPELWKDPSGLRQRWPMQTRHCWSFPGRDVCPEFFAVLRHLEKDVSEGLSPCPDFGSASQAPSCCQCSRSDSGKRLRWWDCCCWARLSCSWGGQCRLQRRWEMGRRCVGHWNCQQSSLRMRNQRTSRRKGLRLGRTLRPRTRKMAQNRIGTCCSWA